MPHCNANNDALGRDINKESKDSIYHADMTALVVSRVGTLLYLQLLQFS